MKSFINFLPPWVETNIQPAFYDKESGTCLQQTARMYAKVNQLVRHFNCLAKETKENVEELSKTVEEYIAKFVELKDYVEDYFDNLDVQEEINNKLDEMSEDGTLPALIAPAYDAYNKNPALLGKFYQKLNKRASFVINCQGDSLTYGQDTVSNDKRPASTDPVDNGATHTQTRASVTYPEELQADFDDILGSGVATVNNLGFSGDSAKLSFERWTINRHADLALVMLGTNDSRNSSSWLPADYRNNITEYLEYMGKIIEQYLAWNTAVIIMTPPSIRDNANDDNNGNNSTNIYADAVKQFANKYNCPVVNTASFITNNFNSDFYSDNIHFNGTGYKAIADKLFAIFCGTGLLNERFDVSTINTINASDNNTVSFGNTGIVLANAPAANTMSGNNKVITIRKDGKACYGFNIHYDNALIIPLNTTGTDVSVTADFGSTQPLSTIKRTNNGVNYKSSISALSYVTATPPRTIRRAIIGCLMNNQYLLLPSKGFHTIKFEHNSNTSDVYFNGFVIMPLEEASKYVNKTTINMYGATVTDNQYSLPLNLINFINCTNIMNEHNNNNPVVSPLTDLTVMSRGGVECYKLDLALNNLELPLNNTSITAINNGLSNSFKYIDEDFAGGSGYKTTVSSFAVDENNLIITFTGYNANNNTSITIG